jgi:hypothetical protein
VFGRSRKRAGEAQGVADEEAAQAQRAADGPFDEEDAPDDGVGRLDLGSVRLPVPDGSQLQIEVDPTGPVRAVHLLTTLGQLTVSAFAAPRTTDIWDDVSEEIVGQLRADGARVERHRGGWGQEVRALKGATAMRFVGVDGPRWMLRGLGSGPAGGIEQLDELLHQVLRGTVVVRGQEALPVRSPLPLTLPEELAAQLRTAAQPPPG